MSPFSAARFGSPPRSRLRKYSANGRSSVSSGPSPTNARISFGPAVNVSSRAANGFDPYVLHPLCASWRPELPVEIVPPQPRSAQVLKPLEQARRGERGDADADLGGAEPSQWIANAI